ncbi:MAG: sulfotransferase [Planctomycetota bacterium]|nr:sulfotransferase [Planctomycetota bacterium]
MLPNFIIIGAAKAGTSSLYHYLRQHPQVYMSPQKETNFFACGKGRPTYCGPGDDRFLNQRAIVDFAQYQSLFNGAGHAKAIGEASPLYLFHPDAAARIRETVPNAKIIAVYRNPIDRAFSSYVYLRRDGRETERTFAGGLKLEEQRRAQNWEWAWQYTRVSRYVEQTKRYLDLFPREQLGLYVYDDLDHEPEPFMRQLFRFLEVDDTFKADTRVRHNVSLIPRERLLVKLPANAPLNRMAYAAAGLLPLNHRLRARGWLVQHSKVPAVLTPEVHAELAERFRDEVDQLGRIIGRDLSFWLKPRPVDEAKPASQAAGEPAAQLKAT